MQASAAHLYACLSEGGPSCSDAERKEQKTRWGSRLMQRKVGRTEGDIGNSTSH